MTTNADKERLLALYKDCRAYQGELHDHSQSGGTSDGHFPLEEWPARMKELGIDFAAILDHRQVRHMYLPVWEDGLFIPGTEPGAQILDSNAEIKWVHYNMLFGDRDELAKVLSEFPEFEFTGGIEGHFGYPDFTKARFSELIDAVFAHGGFFVYPHPNLVTYSEDPLDYWFKDEIGMEVFYTAKDCVQTRENYRIWTALLAAGKRVWATAGGDLHQDPRNDVLTTIYAEEKTSKAYMKRLRKGDLTCGPVGIRMCIGDTATGGKCRFDGKKLVILISDFHFTVNKPEHSFRADVITDRGVEESFEVRPDRESWYSLDANARAFYRVELFDETEGLRIAIGNPIWNEK